MRATLHTGAFEDLDGLFLGAHCKVFQGISDPVAAEAMARSVNDQLAASISNNTIRFGGFASLAMHNATTAAQELKRAVVELGFLGAMINDYRQCLSAKQLWYRSLLM